MSALEQMIITTAGRCPGVKRALQRWALRYSGKLLRSLGGSHATSASLLMSLGSITSGGQTMVGRHTIPRRPAATTVIQIPKRG